MKNFQEIYQLLQRKKEAFAHYELETQTILKCDAETSDQAEAAINRRQVDIESVNVLNHQIQKLLEDNPDAERLSDLMANRCDASNLNPEEKMLFELAQEIFASMNRSHRMEQDALDFMESEKVRLLEKIRETNRSHGQTAKYMKGLASTSSPMNFSKGVFGKA